MSTRSLWSSGNPSLYLPIVFSLLSGCAGLPSSAELDAQANAAIKSSFREQGIAKLDRVQQGPQQPRLADAGLAQQQEGPQRRPGPAHGQPFGLAAHAQRRAHQAHRHHGHRLPCRSAALDGVEQAARLGAGPGTGLVVQPGLEALEGGDRGGMVATQVVQAHQPAPGMFLMWCQRHDAFGQADRGGPGTGWELVDRRRVVGPPLLGT